MTARILQFDLHRRRLTGKSRRPGTVGGVGGFQNAKPAGVPAKLPQVPAAGLAAQAKGQVLVMDDEESIRDLLQQMLSCLGYIPVLSKDGAEAVALYEKALAAGAPFDAVILDLTVFGGMGGKEAMRRLLKMDPDVRAIISSAYIYDRVLCDFEQYGFCGSLEKPYSVHRFAALLQRIIPPKEHG